MGQPFGCLVYAVLGDEPSSRAPAKYRVSGKSTREKQQKISDIDADDAGEQSSGDSNSALRDQGPGRNAGQIFGHEGREGYDS